SRRRTASASARRIGSTLRTDSVISAGIETSIGGGTLSSFGPYSRQIAATRAKYWLLVSAASELSLPKARAIAAAIAPDRATQAAPSFRYERPFVVATMATFGCRRRADCESGRLGRRGVVLAGDVRVAGAKRLLVARVVGQQVDRDRGLGGGRANAVDVVVRRKQRVEVARGERAALRELEGAVPPGEDLLVLRAAVEADEAPGEVVVHRRLGPRRDDEREQRQRAVLGAVQEP